MALTFVAALFLTGEARAQSPEIPTDDQGFAAGVHFAGVRLNQLKEGAAGVGGRIAYDYPLKNILIVSPEIEFNYFPQNPSGNFGESQLLAGAKVGIRRGKIGMFGKVRPGLMHLPGDGDFGARNGGAATQFALDTGVVMEYWPRQHVALRFDVGDTIVYFGSPVNTGLGAARPPGTTHNMQFSTGIMFHF